MTILQAILISGIYWFSAVETPYCLYYLMTTPMCAGALTGLILGDITWFDRRCSRSNDFPGSFRVRRCCAHG